MSRLSFDDCRDLAPQELLDKIGDGRYEKHIDHFRTTLILVNMIERVRDLEEFRDQIARLPAIEADL